MLFRLKNKNIVKNNILFLELDQQSIKELGRIPWSRDKFSQLLNYLSEFNPKLIAFDINFSEPQDASLNEEGMSKLLRTNDLSELEKETLQNLVVIDNDKLFSEAIRASGNVYLSYYGRRSNIDFIDRDIFNNAFQNRNATYWNNMVRRYLSLIDSLRLVELDELQKRYVKEILAQYGYGNDNQKFITEQSRHLTEFFLISVESATDEKEELLRDKLKTILEGFIKQCLTDDLSEKELNRLISLVFKELEYDRIIRFIKGLENKYSKECHNKILDTLLYIYNHTGIWENKMTEEQATTFISEASKIKDNIYSKWDYDKIKEVGHIINKISTLDPKQNEQNISKLWNEANSLIDKGKINKLLSEIKKHLKQIEYLNIRFDNYKNYFNINKIIETSAIKLISEGEKDNYEYLETILFLDAVSYPVNRYAEGFGFTDVILDDDGLIRKVNLLYKYRTIDGNIALLPGFSFKLFMDIYGITSADIELSKNRIIITNKNYAENGLPKIINIPLTSDNSFYINWVNKEWEMMFEHLSIVELFRYNSIKDQPELKDEAETLRNILSSKLKDKIILIGESTAGTTDIGSIPVNSSLPLMSVHGNVLNTLQTNTFIRPLNMFISFFITLILCLLAFVLSIKLRPVIIILIGIVFIFFYYVFSYLMLFNTGLLYYPLYTSLSIFLNYGVITILKYLSIDSERKFIHSAFGQYLSPAVITQIIEDPSKLKLGGQKRNMTAMFTDIQGFSSISERLSPEELVHLLNEYLTEMCEIISRYKGVVDKFEGDAIIAFWGAPLDDDEHAYKSCLCALDMQSRLMELKDRWKDEGKPDYIYNMKMRIGLNSGHMVVGNMGSQSRMDYTIMGDSVNLAARLEGANKFYKTFTMVSQNTYAFIEGRLGTRLLDTVRVVGKKEPIMIYELISKEPEFTDDTSKGLDAYNKALSLYRDRRFKDAIKEFEKVLSFMPDDGPSLTYIERCKGYISNPPSDDWDGVFNFTSKG